MPTTFANTIDGNELYAKRAEQDKNGNQIDTTYAKTSDIPTDVVPAVTSSDDGKVLKASYSGGQGSYSWQNESDGGLSEVAHDDTLTGNGTKINPLGVAETIKQEIADKLSSVSVDGTTITGDGTPGNPLVAAAQHQSITTGKRNGTIAVDGRDVDVKGLGSLAYKSTVGTGDVSSGTYSISISGTAAKATNDSTGENISDQFTSVRQGLSGLQGTVDGILTDDYFFRGVRYYYPTRVERSLTPTLDGKMVTSWTGYNTSNLRICGQLNLIVCNLSSSGYWYDLRVLYYPIGGGNPKTITWTKYAPPNNDGSNIIYMPLFGYTIEVYIYKNSNKNTGALDIYRECILYTGVKEHVDG